MTITKRLYRSKGWPMWRWGLTALSLAVLIWAVVGCSSVQHDTALDLQKAMTDIKKARLDGQLNGQIEALEDKMSDVIAALVSSTE